MDVTIGEVINKVISFCNICEVNVVYGRPFLRLLIEAPSGITRAYMYVIQTSEHTYAVCDSWSDIHGHKYLPTGTISKPFIRESDLVKQWFDGSTEDESEFTTNLNLEKFMRYFYERLSFYEIIKFSPSNFDLKMVDMGFTSNKIKNTLSDTFKKKRRSKGTLADLIKLVMEDHKEFDLPTLLPRELSCVKGKLKDLGLEAIIEGESANSKITHLSFAKRKWVQKEE